MARHHSNIGTPDQIRIMGNKMRGHVVILSCDRFGCHVMQKAIDCVDTDMKIVFISELFRSLKETLTHRFACHVWQRIFETAWKDGPPQIICNIYTALVGQWNSIANDENGSLVVQCILEHSDETAKGVIVSEIFDSTLSIAKGKDTPFCI
jgi:Pumilio-family RNA binding repeat